MQVLGLSGTFCSRTISHRICRKLISERGRQAPLQGPALEIQAARAYGQLLRASVDKQMVVVEELSEHDRAELATDAVVWASQHGLVRPLLCCWYRVNIVQGNNECAVLYELMVAFTYTVKVKISAGPACSGVLLFRQV